MINVTANGNNVNVTFGASELARGLRPSQRLPRNNGFLVTCIGAVARDGVLQVIDQLQRTLNIDGATFPYPQLFVMSDITIISLETSIYEWDGSSLTLVISGLPAGHTWRALDFHQYIYLTNGKCAVIRNIDNGSYATTNLLPFATAACNFNGQVLLAGGDVEYE